MVSDTSAETSALDASNVELAFQQELTEIYRIVSSKALDQDNSGVAPGQGTSIPLSSSNPPGGGEYTQIPSIGFVTHMLISEPQKTLRRDNAVKRSQSPSFIWLRVHGEAAGVGRITGIDESMLCLPRREGVLRRLVLSRRGSLLREA